MRGLIFDFDGLIIDSETLTANLAMQLVADRGVVTELSQWARFVGSTGSDVDAEWDQWLRDLLGPEVDLEELQVILDERRGQLIDQLQPMPGVLETIQAARGRGWKIGLATGHSSTPLLPTLNRLGLLQHFDAIVRSDEVRRPKPAPDIFLETAWRLQLEPSDCLVLEDSVAGYAAAVAAGMEVVVCPCEVTRCSTFPQGALLITSLVELDLSDHD